VEQFVNNVTNIIREAGEFFNIKLGDSGIIKKGRANYVTEVDYKVQEFITKKLKGILPDCNIITEESDNNNYTFDEPTWILDPVDGTTNFMHGYNHSAISLAFVNKGVLELAYVYNPFMNEMFTAIKGKGAFLNGDKMMVTDSTSLENCLVAFGTTPYDRKEAHRTFEITEKVFMSSREVRRSGAASLDLAYVAAGRVDAFYELCLQPWDYAAGILLVSEAGGKVTGWRGEELSLSRPGSVLASNGHVHERMLELLK